jgi:hypothetical protein
MSKRKTFIELQSKPENKAVRRLFDKPKTVDYAPISVQFPKVDGDGTEIENQNADLFSDSAQIERDERVRKTTTEKAKFISQSEKTKKKPETPKSNQSILQAKANTGNWEPESKKESVNRSALASNREAQAKAERLRIFQTSTPVTRTVTKFQKAAIVVRGENGKQLIELLWRDQMNEKTRDIWDFLVKKFEEAAEKGSADEISIRKREILEQSGVKSDRTFISAIYTLEDMGLIEVKRLSGNKEGNIYILTDEGREEIDAHSKQNPSNE